MTLIKFWFDWWIKRVIAISLCRILFKEILQTWRHKNSHARKYWHAESKYRSKLGKTNHREGDNNCVKFSLQGVLVIPKEISVVNETILIFLNCWNIGVFSYLKYYYIKKITLYVFLFYIEQNSSLEFDALLYLFIF